MHNWILSVTDIGLAAYYTEAAIKLSIVTLF